VVEKLPANTDIDIPLNEEVYQIMWAAFLAQPSTSIPVRPPCRLGPRTAPDAWLWFLNL
jgi:hypothetical protein